MGLFKTIRLMLLFYKNFCGVSLAITLFCVGTFWRYNFHLFFFLFWFKVITLGLIYYFINMTKKNEFYYYQNLGLSKEILWIATLAFDFIICIALFILVYKLV